MNFDKAGLLQMFAPKVVPITLELDGQSASLYVKELDAAQVFDLQEKRKANSDNRTFAVMLIASALCDEEGKPVLTVEEAKDLMKFKIQAFNRLAEKIAQAVGLSEQEPEPGKV
jgi:type II secretory pathway predicted ATPase ExeA